MHIGPALVVPIITRPRTTNLWTRPRSYTWYLIMNSATFVANTTECKCVRATLDFVIYATWRDTCVLLAQLYSETPTTVSTSSLRNRYKENQPARNDDETKILSTCTKNNLNKHNMRFLFLQAATFALSVGAVP